MMIVKMSIQGALLILTILMLRRLFEKKLPARLLMIFWGVVVLRLLVPVSIPAPYGLAAVASELSAKPVQTVVEEGADQVPTPDSKTGDKEGTAADGGGVGIAAKNPAVGTWLTFFWILGACGCGVMFVGRHLKSRRNYAESFPLPPGFAAAWRQSHRLMRRVELRSFDQIRTPLTYGIIRPIILLPKTAMDLDGQKMDYILTHEWTHIRSWDTLGKWLLAAALCIHWFNPLVWLMYMLACRDMEICCDECVMKDSNKELRRDYALCLIALEEQKEGFLSLSSCFSKNATEERVKRIMSKKKINVLIAGLCGLALCVAAFFFGTSVPVKSEDTDTGVTASEAISNKNYPEYEKLRGDKTALLQELEKVKKEEASNQEKAYNVTENTDHIFEAASGSETAGSGSNDDTTIFISDSAGEYGKPLEGISGTDTSSGTQEIPTEKMDDTISRRLQLEQYLLEIETQENIQERYGEYGISYDSKTFSILLDGKPIRYFVDNWGGDEHNFSGTYFANPIGEIAVKVMRDEDNEITGLKKYDSDKIPTFFKKLAGDED